ncbi:DUF4402 domain-containing protein [Sphingomonas sp.]|uniref:DUF4402 domain-containing protein n=1 Tax=Sphingomonas sp. TaxID=28214 RepID=UPI0025EAC5A6|nr:DUF4402 domain-containing protein [Sphingomonas sp.]MBV9527554.1 DUF4402 domain-containing protein [Sphingomonas sp.]
MMRNIRALSLGATGLALIFAAEPAVAAPTPVSPDQQATATVRVVKPLTLKWVRDLDLGTVLLSGAGTWTGATVGITKGGVFSCPGSNVTCSGATKTAEYTITGTNNQVVTVSAANVTLTNQNNNAKTLTLTVDAPATVNLGNSGSAGTPLDIGGNISVDSSTTDGTYVGTFAVTVNY